MIGKTFINASGKTIQVPNRISKEFCWSPNERITIRQRITIGEAPGFIVENIDYVGVHKAHETAWITEELLNQSFKEISL